MCIVSMQNMEFDDLRTFVTVAETRSVSQAARQLFLTQPATPAGHQVLERCRRVLHSVREVQEAIAGDGVPAGELKVGVAHALTEIALTRPLDFIRKKFPRVDIRLTTGWSRVLLERVRAGSLDGAVILLPEEDVLPAGIQGAAVGKEQLVVVAPKEKAVRRRKAEDLRGVHWILNPEGCGARSSLQRALQRHNVEMHVALETYNYELQLNLVARNRGWSLVPSRILHRSAVRARLRVLPIDGLRFPLTVWTVTREAEMRLAAVIEQFNRQLNEKLSVRPR